MPHFKWTAAGVAVLICTAACDSAVSPRQSPMAIGGLDTSPWQLPALPAPAQVVVALSTAELSVGQSAHASATALTEDGNLMAGRTIAWSSDDSSVATVDNDGLIQGVAAGSTRIVATIGGVTGAAVVQVIAAPPSPTVASVSVALTRTVVNSGETADATATARDAMGSVVAGQPVAWTSANPRVATVSGSGVVVAVSPGTASIIATVGGVSGEATLTVATIDPGVANNSPSPGHPNEPAGFTQLSSVLSCDTVPLTVSGPTAAYELGWIQRDAGAITITEDQDVPFTSKKVCNVNFPSGMIGGGSPSDVWTYQWGVNPGNWGAMNPPRKPKSLYMSFWYKLSPNFPANLIANKIIYPYVFYSKAPVLTMFISSGGEGTQSTTPLVPCIAFQEVEIDGNHFAGCTTPAWFESDPAKWAYVQRGVWQHWETLYTLESVGGHDGSAKLWIDGKLAINWEKRIRFMPLDLTSDHIWHGAAWTPVYGGASGSIPNDGVGGYHRLKDLYVSGK